jgi:CDP-glucose 4,6-dehydratase
MENMVELFDNTYRGKKVFLTGHTGFKGAWLLKTLKHLGAEVKGYSLAPEVEDSLYDLLNGFELCHSVIADIMDRERIKKEILSFQPDFVFHLAAQALVRPSYELPVETFEINCIGTANVLEGVRRMEKKCSVVLITTDKVYHNNEWIYPYRESDQLGGYDPYSASKACAEILISSYRNSFFNPGQYSKHQKAIAVARSGNVIGGGDWSKDRLIPDIVKALNEGQEIKIRNPHAVRPWQHVMEPVVGYLLLGAKLCQDPVRFAQAYNFGPLPSDALEVVEIVEKCITHWGSGNFYINKMEDAPHEAGLLKLDISKVQAEILWEPQLSASEAIKASIEWYVQFFNDKRSIIDFTEKQIRSFLHV